MAEFMLKYADPRGEVHNQVPTDLPSRRSANGSRARDFWSIR